MEGGSPEERGEGAGAEGGWLPPVPPGPQQPPGPQAPAPGAAAPGAVPPGYETPPGYEAPPGYGGPPQPPAWQQPQWQQPGWQQPWTGPPDPGNGTAITGFVLSIASIVLLVFTLGVSSIFSLGLAIAGTIVGRNGRLKVDRGQTRQHRGLGQAGYVIGIVGIVLSVLSTIVWIVVFAVVDEINFDEDDDFFEDEFDSARIAGAVLASALRQLV